VAQWRVNQLNSITRRFKTASVEFQQALSEFNKVLKDSQKRLIKIVDTEEKLSDEKVDEMVEDYEAAELYLKQQFQMVEVSDEMLDRLAEIEERHEGMKRIAKNIQELHAMFEELHLLVSEQGEMLDNIEHNVTQTKDYVRSGVKKLESAEKHQKCTRKTQLYLCCGCIVLLLVLIISLFGSGAFSGS